MNSELYGKSKKLICTSNIHLIIFAQFVDIINVIKYWLMFKVKSLNPVSLDMR